MKPRLRGITMILDRCQGLVATEDLLRMCGAYLDHIKLSFGTSALLTEDFLRRKIDLVRSHNVDIYPGGTLMELALVQGCFSDYLQRAKELGFTTLEISDGTITIPRRVRDDAIKRTLDAGFLVITEVGKKDPAANIPPAQMAEEIAADLALGANHVIIEARESGMGIGIYDQSGRIRMDIATAILEGLNPDQHDSIIWEAPHQKQQAELIIQLGTNVSLGNVRPRDVLGLEALRCGLRFETFRHFAQHLEPMESING
ncbi:MAG: phosphosulfolactate synthase [Chloroflexi bacterium]|nr:phosphosulfolactate synthase [Chloroflexota bacterium]